MSRDKDGDCEGARDMPWNLGTYPASFRQETTTNGGGGRRWFYGATGPARLALAVNYELGASPVEAFESSNI